MNRHFSKEYMQMAKRQVKKCSTSLIITQMRIKTTMKITHTRTAIIKNKNKNKKTPQQMFVRMCRKGNLCTLLVGM